MNPADNAALGVSGRIARAFLTSQITPLLALVALLMGVFALLVTPKEEEPQINVTMANVFIPFAGATSEDVHNLVTVPAEQVVSQITGIEHVYSVTRPGLAVLTVQYKVGQDRIAALVRLYDTLSANRDWVPAHLGVGEFIVKPKGIDDVPIVSLTMYSKRPDATAESLAKIAHAIEIELKRVPGTREVTTYGGPDQVVRVTLDPERLAAHRITVTDIERALRATNASAPAGSLTSGNRAIEVRTGEFFADARDVAQLVVGVRGEGTDRRPVYLSDVARVTDGADVPTRFVWHGENVKAADGTVRYTEFPAVTIAVSKKPGENASTVADALMARVDELRGTVIPDDVQIALTRNYGDTARDKANKLIQKLIFATLSVVALVWATLGRREAVIVGVAVVLTLATTLFASWAWGFTLNRVSLFALIFSIGILVDDAIVVVENIHRRSAFDHAAPTEMIPRAVDEVGGPTILATLTVIAALLPMAFVTGLMGPYMAPIPINSSMGMLLSLAIAFVVTPWLALRLLHRHFAGAHAAPASADKLSQRLAAFFTKAMTPFLRAEAGRANRRKLWIGVFVAIALSVALVPAKLVVMKMLPFDNKSEFQVVVDMPTGTAVERTAGVLRELAAEVAKVPEVTSVQAYAGLAAPINLTAWCASTTCAPAARSATCRSISSTSTRATARAMTSRKACCRRCRRSPSVTAPISRSSKSRRARRCCRRSSPRSTAPTTTRRSSSPSRCARRSRRRPTSSRSTIPRSMPRAASYCASTRRRPRCTASRSPRSRARRGSRSPARTSRRCTTGRASTQCRCASRSHPRRWATSTPCSSSGCADRTQAAAATKWRSPSWFGR